jgi:hypothetical protein
MTPQMEAATKKTNMKPKKKVTWVVYQMTIHKRADRLTAVCEQSEWDALELGRPGYHVLVREGIPTEVEAELLARESTDNSNVSPDPQQSRAAALTFKK